MTHKAVLAVAALMGACATQTVIEPAAAPTPDPQFACIDGLTVERAQQLLAWTAGTMELSIDAVSMPWIECAAPADMAEFYGLAGVQAAEHLGVYVRPMATIFVTSARKYPEGNEHIIVHEMAHHLQHEHGMAELMTVDELEEQALAVHQLWIVQR